jgi:hypothetical protein
VSTPSFHTFLPVSSLSHNITAIMCCLTPVFTLHFSVPLQHTVTRHTIQMFFILVI